MSRTAIIAGQGALPGLLARAMAAGGEAPVVAELDGFPADLPGGDPVRFRIERLAPFLDHLVDAGVTRVVFAGAVRRPKLDPELFDARTAQLVPALLAAFQAGDDALLREVAALFESWGLEVVGADQVAPALVPAAGELTGTPSEADRRDVARAAEIVAAIGGLDLGQGAVVAQGLCIAVETQPGTDAMLDFAGRHLQRLRADAGGGRGILYKAPKPGQDRRIDMPSLGPDTVAAAARAGLAGIAWAAGGVLLLDRAATVAAAESEGMFLWSRTP